MDTKLETKTAERLDERRKVLRHRTLKAGTISFNADAAFDCRVRNLSEKGACLEVASQIGIPDNFVLVLESDHQHRKCHVIWRTLSRLGVTFQA